jgi:hypothetical protein
MTLQNIIYNPRYKMDVLLSKSSHVRLGSSPPSNILLLSCFWTPKAVPHNNQEEPICLFINPHSNSLLARNDLASIGTMALEAFIKDLVGTASDVQIIFDNSRSDLPSLEQIQDATCAHQDDETNTQAQHHEQWYPSTPQQDKNNRVLLDDFRERQRLIRQSMSPGVSPAAKSPGSSRTPNGSPGDKRSSTSRTSPSSFKKENFDVNLSII